MQITYRHGILQGQGFPPQFLQRSGLSVNIVVTTTPLLATVASDTKNYLIREEFQVNGAWSSLPSTGTAVLYWDINTSTGVVTRGWFKGDFTLATVAPEFPNVDDHWFDLTNIGMNYWDGYVWVPVLRVFAGTFTNLFGAVSSDFSSQIGIVGEFIAGYIEYDLNHRGIKDADNNFLTTADKRIVQIGEFNQPLSSAGSPMLLVSTESIPEFSLVAVDGDNQVKLADNASAAWAVGIIDAPAPIGSTVTLLNTGVIEYSIWDFTGHLGEIVWLGTNGELTLTRPSTTLAQIIGTVLTSRSIILSLKVDLNYTGPTGPAGPQGDVGPSGGVSGYSGASGFSGMQGVQGPIGIQGVVGPIGPRGLQGLIGPSGSTGVQGQPGISGTSGWSGISGFSGYSGRSGAVGSIGLTGLTGLQGQPGTSGYSGKSGFSGYSGSIGTTGLTGLSGYSGIGTTGAQGQPGTSGYSGKSGFSGYSGSVGTTGSTGLSGYSGKSGVSGIQGQPGTSGYSGKSGYSGTQGISGYSGHVGNTGLQGLTGAQGQPGTSGYSGKSGYSGATGVSGYSGHMGNTGLQGLTGAQGQPGISGYSGMQGPIGPIGETGMQGELGLRGMTGSKGVSGYSGNSGYSGTMTTTIPTLTVNGTAWFPGTGAAIAAVFTNFVNITNTSASVATGVIPFDVTEQTTLYYTANASSNWTVNFRATDSRTLDSIMSVGQSLIVGFSVTQGATPYFNNAVQVDGASITPKWQTSAPVAGNANSIDVYNYTIIKTAAATFTVFASQTKYV